MVDYSFKEDFKYKHENPYHDKLGEFGEFVMRDHEAENCGGKWNSEVFKREAPLFLEIGTGAGHFMMDYCNDHPEHHFVGLDYRFKRSFHLAKKLSTLEFDSSKLILPKTIIKQGHQRPCLPKLYSIIINFFDTFNHTNSL